jgi:hypothetical protein
VAVTANWPDDPDTRRRGQGAPRGLRPQEHWPDRGPHRDTPGVTEYVEIPGRGHSLTIDGGWREVCDTALAFLKRFV